MKKVKILVVEDEIIIADNLCDTLEDLGYNPLEPAISYTEALVQVADCEPDIAILDIQLAGKKTGIDLGLKIKESYSFPFIFLTSNSDKVTLDKAKAAMPASYLVKPFTKEELYSTIEIVLSNHKQLKVEAPNESLFIKDKGGLIKIVLEDILFLKSAHVYTEITFKNNTVKLVRSSLNYFSENLNCNFVRVHRGYIVNTNYLSKINKSSLEINNITIPIGAKYKSSLLSKVNLI